MATKRLFQLLVAVEDQPGVVAPQLVSLNSAKTLVSDPKVTYDRGTYDRQINRTSLTPLTPIEGTVEASCTFRVELAGTSASGGNASPSWGALLQACGLKQRTLGLLNGIGAVGGASPPAFWSGENVDDDASAGENAEIVHDVWNGSTRLYYADPEDVSGGWTNADALTGDDSGATTTLSTPVTTDQHGTCWTPISRPSVRLTGDITTADLAVGDIIVGGTGGAVLQIVSSDALTSGSNDTNIVCYLLDVGEFVSGSEVFTVVGSSTAVLTLNAADFVRQLDWPSISLGVIEDGVMRLLKGCRGSVTFTANLGEPMFMDFEFKGLISSIEDGQLSGNPVPTSLVPPTFLEIGYGLGRDADEQTVTSEHTPCINSWSLEWRNEISIEKCAASTDGTRGAAFPSGRSVTGSIDPSVRPEASFPFLDSFRNGTTFRQRLTLGSAAGNSFHISVPATQITSEGDGERDGLATRDLQYQASGKRPDGVDGEDREFVLSYHKAEVYRR